VGTPALIVISLLLLSSCSLRLSEPDRPRQKSPIEEIKLTFANVAQLVESGADFERPSCFSYVKAVHASDRGWPSIDVSKKSLFTQDEDRRKFDRVASAIGSRAEISSFDSELRNFFCDGGPGSFNVTEEIMGPEFPGTDKARFFIALMPTQMAPRPFIAVLAVKDDYIVRVIEELDMPLQGCEEESPVTPNGCVEEFLAQAGKPDTKSKTSVRMQQLTKYYQFRLETER
jgi:hypothetical protein